MSKDIVIQSSTIRALLSITGKEAGPLIHYDHNSPPVISEDNDLFGYSSVMLLDICCEGKIKSINLDLIGSTLAGEHKLNGLITEELRCINIPIRELHEVAPPIFIAPSFTHESSLYVIGYKGRHCLTVPEWLISPIINVFNDEVGSLRRGELTIEKIKEVFSDPNWHIVRVPNNINEYVLEAGLYHLSKDDMVNAGVESITIVGSTAIVTVSDQLYALCQLVL